MRKPARASLGSAVALAATAASLLLLGSGCGESNASGAARTTGGSNEQPPVVRAGTPIPLSTVGASPVAPFAGTPTEVAPASSETPIPASCSTPAGSPAAASTPTTGGQLPLRGPRAPGPYQENGSVTVLDGLAVQVDATESLEWVPNTIIVRPGQSVIIDIKNGGHTTHDFCSPALLNTDVPIRVPAPHVAAEVLTAVITFTAPPEPGIYDFWSNADRQAEAGMVGRVIVRP